MERSSEYSILVAHERLVIGQAIHRVLAAQGFRVEVVANTEATVAALRRQAWDGLVLDVALPGQPVYELVQLAKTDLPRPVGAVILVASVFRRTSYKRKPVQLYGADDYVEIHRLGDDLPSKLWHLLAVDPSGIRGMLEAEAVLATLQAEGDQRLFDEAPLADDPGESAIRAVRLAELIVADVILYSGDRLIAADTPAEAREALAADLETARELYRSVAGVGSPDVDPIGDAFDDMLHSLVSPHPSPKP
jgi:CheY-like chemotaxis protein